MTKHVVMTLVMLLSVPAARPGVCAEPVRFDYTKHPVVAPPNVPVPELELTNVCRAFDGYGAQGSRPGAVARWVKELPAVCELDYGEPVAVSAYVHYFYVPNGRDYRTVSPVSSAYKKLRVWSKPGTDDWRLVAEFDNLPSECPQIITLPATEPSRLWKLEILELAPGAGFVTYEIETYTGGTPSFAPSGDPPFPDIPKDFTRRMLEHKPTSGSVHGDMTLATDRDNFDVMFNHSGKSARSECSILVSGKPVSLSETGKNRWRGELDGGNIIVESIKTPMGIMLSLTYDAVPSQPVRYRNFTLSLGASDVDVYYMPGYVWSREPATSMSMLSTAFTSLTALCVEGMSIGMIPSTDRGLLGFREGLAQCDLIAGDEPVTVLITGVAGTWWDIYRFAVSEIFDFREQQQTVPVSEIQYGVSRYLLSDEVWEPHTNTLRSWPEHDPHYRLYGNGEDLFAFYGAPYSIPAYLDRFIMNGNPLARDRARDIVRWLCRSNVRMQYGPARGAFFNLQRFTGGETPSIFKPGSTQARTDIMTSQSTGGALWALLYYRTVTGDTDSEVSMVMDEAVQWLMKTQNAEGGWPYGHYTDGNPVPAASSSGCIWNIWALWRYGKMTGDRQYTDAAQRATAWYDTTFIRQHHFHGYWEDVGPGSREGYEAALAAVAFSEMGENDLAVATARDAVQWVYTRRIESREAHNSAGLVGEQTGWPPAPYCTPMMGLASWCAWTITGDPFWKPFAMNPKALGWWYSPDKGTVDWVIESTMMTPMAGNVFVSWWSDWIIAQVGSLSLRWLIREIGRCSAGAVEIDEERLTGSAFGGTVRCWTPPGGLHPNLPIHGQANWLGLIGDESVMVAFVNHGPEDRIACQIDSRDLNGALVWPRRAYRIYDGHVEITDWDGTIPVTIGQEGVTVLEWGFRR